MDPTNATPLQGMVAPSFMATQVDIIKSDRVAAARGRSCCRRTRPPTRRLARDRRRRSPRPKRWLAANLQTGLDVKPARETNIINMTWIGRSPAEAAARRRTRSRRPTSRPTWTSRPSPRQEVHGWFDEQVKFARDRLEKAQQKLAAYQEKAGVISADGVDMESQRLNELSSQLTMVQGQLTDVANKRNAGASSVAETMASPLINSLKADIAKQEARIQEASANPGRPPPADGPDAGRAQCHAPSPGPGDRQHRQLDQHRVRSGQGPPSASCRALSPPSAPA